MQITIYETLTVEGTLNFSFDTETEELKTKLYRVTCSDKFVPLSVLPKHIVAALLARLSTYLSHCQSLHFNTERIRPFLQVEELVGLSKICEIFSGMIAVLSWRGVLASEMDLHVYTGIMYIM